MTSVSIQSIATPERVSLEMPALSGLRMERKEERSQVWERVPEEEQTVITIITIVIAIIIAIIITVTRGR